MPGVVFCRCKQFLFCIRPAGKDETMENDLGYREFCSQFDAFFRRNEKNFGNGKGAVHYRFYPKGFTAVRDEDARFIRDINARYYHQESDRLQGDFAVLEKDGTGKARTYCRFSAEKMYEDYQKYGWDIVKEAVYENLEYCNSEEIGILDQMENYERIKHRLFIRPLCYNNFAWEAGRYIYRRFEDMALVLYVLIRDDERGIDSAKIPKEMLEKWNRNRDTVMDEALVNTYSMAQPRMYMSPFECIRPPFERGAFMSFNSPIRSLDRMDMPTVTTTKMTNGAIAMFYTGVKEKIAELYGDSYYVVFTSIHEAKTHCRGSFAPRDMLKSLKEINRVFPRKEMLSNRVYYYDREKGTFEALLL